MKIKKAISIIIIICILLFGGRYAVYKYIFPFKHEDAITKYSNEYNLDPRFVLSIIKAESKFNSQAISNKNAVGLMQITEETAEWVAEQMNLKDYSPDKLYEEEYNIKMGCWYLNDLENEFGSQDLVIAAYNAGRGTVNNWLSNPKYSDDGISLTYIPYSETKNYVERVNVYYKIYQKLYD